MFFSKKQKPSLVEAITLVHEATEIAYVYLRDASYCPTKRQLVHFWQLENTLLESYTTLRHIHGVMQQRASKDG